MRTCCICGRADRISSRSSGDILIYGCGKCYGGFWEKNQIEPTRSEKSARVDLYPYGRPTLPYRNERKAGIIEESITQVVENEKPLESQARGQE